MVLGNTFHLFLHARPRADRAARRPASLHALGRPGDHRLRRLPGLLDGPRHRRRRDQGPRARSPAASARARSSRSTSRASASAPTSTARRVHGPGDLDGGAGGARLGHRARVRRVHAVPRRRASTRRARPSARTAGSTAAWPGTGARAGGPGRLRDRPGRGATRTCAARPPRRSPRGALGGIAIGGSLGEDKAQMFEVVELDDRGAAGGRAAAPAGHRRGRRPRARRRARDRHVRLRDADPASAATAWRSCPTRRALARGPGQGPLARGRRAAARGLPCPACAAATPAPTCTTCCAPRADRACAC